MKNDKKNVQSVDAVRKGSELFDRDETQKSSYTTSADYILTEEGKEHPYGESLTELDSTLPIHEIMKRAMQGIAPKVGKPVYSETDEFDEVDILKMSQADPVDRTAIKQSLLMDIDRLESEASSALSEADSKAKEEVKPAS